MKNVIRLLGSKLFLAYALVVAALPVPAFAEIAASPTVVEYSI